MTRSAVFEIETVRLSALKILAQPFLRRVDARLRDKSRVVRADSYAAHTADAAACVGVDLHVQRLHRAEIDAGAAVGAFGSVERRGRGFALNDDLLKRAGGGNYFDELLARIRDIRSSEKVFYRKVQRIRQVQGAYQE